MAALNGKILQIIPKLEAGGAELAVIDMAEAVVRREAAPLFLPNGEDDAAPMKRSVERRSTFRPRPRTPSLCWRTRARDCRLDRTEGVCSCTRAAGRRRGAL